MLYPNFLELQEAIIFYRWHCSCVSSKNMFNNCPLQCIKQKYFTNNTNIDWDQKGWARGYCWKLDDYKFGKG